MSSHDAFLTLLGRTDDAGASAALRKVFYHLWDNGPFNAQEIMEATGLSDDVVFKTLQALEGARAIYWCVGYRGWLPCGGDPRSSF
ncbi:hypothetical protein EBR96_09665 [bacterium]|nr:hypothetical protein [bacterium]